MRTRRNKNDAPHAADSSIEAKGILQYFRDWQKRIGFYSILSAVPTLMAGNCQSVLAEDISARQLKTVASESLLKTRAKPAFLRKMGDYRMPYQKGRSDVVSNLIANDDCPGTPIPKGVYTGSTSYVDSGNTAGANDTVTSLGQYGYYYTYYYGSDGPDRIYSFTMVSRGSNPEIKVTSTSSSYRPLIYLYPGCPSGTDQTIFPWQIDDARWSSGNTARRGLNWLENGGSFSLFIDSNAAGEGGEYTLTINDVKIGQFLEWVWGLSYDVPVPGDYIGGNGSELAIFREGQWWLLDHSTGNHVVAQWGLAGDIPVPADYDGDGKTDLAVFRPSDSVWYIYGSTQGPMIVQWGVSTDVPVPADYDDDDKADVAVFRNGTWWILKSSDLNPIVVHWGVAGDFPAPGDYFGNGRAEVAVYRGHQWWGYDLATGQHSSVQTWVGANPVREDYDGDGKTDIATYEDGTWLYIPSGGANRESLSFWGTRPVPSDYDGDGKADFAMFEPVQGRWKVIFAP